MPGQPWQVQQPGQQPGSTALLQELDAELHQWQAHVEQRRAELQRCQQQQGGVETAQQVQLRCLMLQAEVALRQLQWQRQLLAQPCSVQHVQAGEQGQGQGQGRGQVHSEQVCWLELSFWQAVSQLLGAQQRLQGLQAGPGQAGAGQGADPVQQGVQQPGDDLGARMPLVWQYLKRAEQEVQRLHAMEVGAPGH